MMEILKRLRDTHAVTMAAALDEAAAAAAADAAKTPEVLVKPKTMDPEQSWKNLTKDNRKLLKRYADTQIMKDTHAQITEFISNKEVRSLKQFAN
jgi:sialic acid synthase SpsE